MAQGPLPASASIDELTVFGSGFRMLPDEPGRAIAGVGDLNGDGIDDVAVGVEGAEPDGRRRAGRVYVVFGRDASLPTEIDLDALSGTNGFRLDGALERDALGSSVAPAGDLNGDGIDDMIVGAPRSGDYGPKEPGRCYVVFGRRGAFPPVLRTDELEGANGLRFEGHAAEGERHVGTGVSVGGVGDINGDGIDDVAIGAPGAWVGDDSYVGKAHVLFGRRDPFPAIVAAADLDGDNGFTIPGLALEDFFGRVASGRGDLNGDGIDDLVFSAASAGNGGELYVVFGRASGFPAEFDLATLDGSNGLTIGNDSGTLGRAALGVSVALGGDVNGDGIDDLVAGASSAGPRGVYFTHAGKSFVVYGRDGGFPAAIDVATLDGANGFRIDGDQPEDSSGSAVAIVGDTNGDGFEDVVIGAMYRGAELCGFYVCRDKGAAYVVFGGDDVAAEVSLADVDGERIARIEGEDGGPGGGLGVDVARAGDLNDDGVPDFALRGGQNAYVVYGRGLTCRADLDGDGELTIFDFLAFQNAFDAGDPVADFDGDGALTIFDFLAFQNEFDAGCA